MLPSSRRAATVALAVLAVVTGFLFFGAANTHAADTASSFSAKTVFGDEFSLDGYLGKVPILLDFGSIYCSSCIKSIPHLIVLQKKYTEEKLKVVGVNLDTYGLRRVKKFFSSLRESMNFPMLVDKGLKISKSFDILTLPTYILIDADGNIVSKLVGYDDEIQKKMDAQIEQLVSGGEIEDAVPVEGGEVSILTPDNFTMTYQDTMSVIGLTGGYPGPFAVRLNGGSEIKAFSNSEMFYVRIPLSLGSNFIEVIYPKGDGMATLAVVMFREPKMGEVMQLNFPRYQFHLPEKEEGCAGCHVMEVDSDGPMTDFCAGCHSDQTDVKYVHGPITVGGCAACHEFESAPHKYDIGPQGSDLCFFCHDDIQEKFARANVHGPVVMGFCTVCHSPHGSQYRFQLTNVQSTMCLGCHDDGKAKTSGFVVHRPVEEDNCTGCHDPHSSDNPLYFLKGEGVDLCTRCHDESVMDSHSHPTEGVPPFVKPGMKLDANKELNCQTCHNPHSSDSETLFTVEGGCAGCHEI